jgi:hypothetical protein
MTINGGLLAQAKARKASVSAVITRADGTVIDLGIVAYYHRNTIVRWIGNMLVALKRRFKEKQ